VHVTTIHPGRFGTEFLGSAHVVAPDETYAITVGATISRETTLPADAWRDPSFVVDAVLAVVTHRNPRDGWLSGTMLWRRSGMRCRLRSTSLLNGNPLAG
jgi:NAD(P)-dependent dehydrogenase (short-subunit alcohol dehydrogenase family)